VALADVISDARRILEDDPFQDELSDALTSSPTDRSLSVDQPGAWEEGDIGEFVDGERIYVHDIPTAGANPFTITRGHDNTTAAAHAVDDIVLKNPRYSYDQISRAINRTADVLYPEVFEVKTTSITPSTTANIYNLPTEYEHFLDLQQQATGTITDIVQIVPLSEVWNVPVAILASGKGLRIRFARGDVNATLTYGAKVGSGVSDAQAQRILALGTALQLLKSEAGIKADRAGDRDDRTRRMLQAARFIGEEFEAAKSSYRAALQARWGRVRRFRRAPRYVDVR
jgi:hypothetical protein